MYEFIKMFSSLDVGIYLFLIACVWQTYSYEATIFNSVLIAVLRWQDYAIVAKCRHSPTRLSFVFSVRSPPRKFKNAGVLIHTQATIYEA